MKPYELQVLAERFATSGGRRITVTAETARTVAHALRIYADVLSSRSDEPGFRIDVWDDKGGIIETLARCAIYQIGKAAYEQACRDRPTYEVTLRRGAHVLAKRQAAGTNVTTPASVLKG